MKFDINKVYTAVNADELKVGSRVVAADTIDELRAGVIENNPSCCIGRLEYILSGTNVYRFKVNNTEWALCYLLSEPEKLKWTDLKIGDVIRNKELPFIKHLITGIDEGAGQVFFCSSWTKGDELENWEKVDLELEEYERRVEE